MMLKNFWFLIKPEMFDSAGQNDVTSVITMTNFDPNSAVLSGTWQYEIGTVVVALKMPPVCHSVSEFVVFSQNTSFSGDYWFHQLEEEGEGGVGSERCSCCNCCAIYPSQVDFTLAEKFTSYIQLASTTYSYLITATTLTPLLSMLSRSLIQGHSVIFEKYYKLVALLQEWCYLNLDTVFLIFSSVSPAHNFIIHFVKSILVF